MSKKRKIWSFKPGRIALPIDPKVISNELHRINDKHGELKPRHVVDESRPTKAPLHPIFEWNDKKAADEYRLHQARNIINVIQITTIDDKGRRNTVPEFVNVSTPTEGAPQDRTYQKIEVAMENDETRKRIIENCLHKLLQVRDNYRHLLEFSKVWAAVDAIDVELMKT